MRKSALSLKRESLYVYSSIETLSSEQILERKGGKEVMIITKISSVCNNVLYANAVEQY